jgi:hypothetical protein
MNSIAKMRIKDDKTSPTIQLSTIKFSKYKSVYDMYSLMT